MENTRFVVQFIDQDAHDQFEALLKAIQKTLGRAIRDRLEIDPVSFGKPLRHSLKGHRRLRVGDYSIVYKINEKEKIVTIVVVYHRKDVYEEL